MKINVNKVLATAEAKRNAPKPTPRIVVSDKPRVYKKVGTVEIPGIDRVLKAHDENTAKKDLLLKDLWDQMGTVKKDRAILSSKTPDIVSSVHAALLRDEGPTAAKEFMDGNVAMPAIADHYAAIHSYTEKAQHLYDNIKHVEMYGELPVMAAPASASIESNDVNALKLQLHGLKELICKTKRKIAIGKAKNPTRVTEWGEKLAMAEAQREDIRAKIKQLQYDARNKRPGAE